MLWKRHAEPNDVQVIRSIHTACTGRPPPLRFEFWGVEFCGIDFSGGAIPSCVSACASMMSIGIWMTLRQYTVSVDSKLPFSKYLFDGAPPPHTEKYWQVSAQRLQPRSMALAICLNLGDAKISAIGSRRILPKMKSP